MESYADLDGFKKKKRSVYRKGRKVKGGQKIKMVTRGNQGRGSRGSCGGTRRRDGSGKGVGNRGTARQPKDGKRR